MIMIMNAEAEAGTEISNLTGRNQDSSGENEEHGFYYNMEHSSISTGLDWIDRIRLEFGWI
jgi:hypothetical protein